VGYRRRFLVGDLMAGLIVAIMLVPQSMAYAMLAGLPPQTGLYASILPLVLYGLFGTSRALAVAPVAIVSLLVATALGPLAEVGSASYVQLALTLALLVGLVKMGMGILRLGFLVNFLSQPVLVGFTSAAVIIIGFSQLRHLLGISIPRTQYFHQSVLYLAQNSASIHLVTLAIGLGSVGVLLVFRRYLGGLLRRWRLPEGAILPLTKAGPLVVVVLGTLLVSAFGLDGSHSVAIVGDVPPGLPPLTLPTFELSTWRTLLPAALTISFVGYLQSIAVAKALAAKRRESVGVNRELVALGAANLGAAVTGGFPVTGGFSRSVVNDSAGANTPLAGIITAALMGLVVVLMTPVFFFLPTAALAAIILVAVAGLIDFSVLAEIWHDNKADAAVMVVTFVAVLGLGVEKGIIVGIFMVLLRYLWRTVQPHVASIGRLGHGEILRTFKGHQVKTCQHVLAVRIDESAFANATVFEDTLVRIAVEQPGTEHLVLDGSAINFIDASGLQSLDTFRLRLRDAGVRLYLSGIKDPVQDRMRDAGFLETLGTESVFMDTNAAFAAFGCA
jgi:SulP family sulfate permease